MPKLAPDVAPGLVGSLYTVDLQLFVRIARLRQFKQAAGELGISVSMATERRQRLEHALGVQLFVTTTREVLLTDAGLRLLPIATEIVALAERAFAAVRDSSIRATPVEQPAAPPPAPPRQYRPKPSKEPVMPVEEDDPTEETIRPTSRRDVENPFALPKPDRGTFDLGIRARRKLGD